MDDDFDYAAAFATVDLAELQRDIEQVMTTSQDWWPADFGHYGPLFIRMAWHSAGTYRISDGRGGAGAGMQRFAPLNSWPDNGNLDKARRLLWPVKQKYGRSLSWADLMVFAGNCALESMGFTTFGFAGGRADVWEPDEDVYWGPEETWLGDDRYTGDRELENPLAAVQMGLIYVNPEGPNGQPDPMAAARDIRETFAPDGDERRGDRRADRRRPHLRQDPRRGRPRPVRRAGARGRARSRSRAWAGRTPSAAARAATPSPAASRSPGPPRRPAGATRFFDNLFGHEWELTQSPAGANQWQPKDGASAGTVPDPEDGSLTRPPTMLTTDLALRVDPVYEPISRRFHEHPEQFADAFARAWFKLTHRDMGPIQRYLGPLRAAGDADLAGPGAGRRPTTLIDAGDIAALKAQILASGPSVAQLVSAAWASASTFRSSDKRGGANGGRVRLQPQIGWEVNDPAELATVAPRAGGRPVLVQRRADRRQAGLAGRPDRPRRLRRGRAGGHRPRATT